MNNYCVYFIAENKPNGCVKIGFSNNLDKRIEGLQIGNPNELFVCGTISNLSKQSAVSLEKCCHRMSANFHVRGEWFKRGCIKRILKSKTITMPIGAKISFCGA